MKTDDGTNDASDLADAIANSTVRVINTYTGQWQLSEEAKGMIVSALRRMAKPEGASKTYDLKDMETFCSRAALAAIEHCQPAVDALRAFVKAEESFLASVKPGVVDDHLTEAYKQAKAALAEMDERESRLPQKD